MKWINAPNIKIQKDIISQRNCNRIDLVNIKIMFITDLDCASYDQYFQSPKPMIERKICQIFDRNPNLIKVLDRMPEPYKNHIVNKHWGVKFKAPDDSIKIGIPVDWMNLEPNI